MATPATKSELRTHAEGLAPATADESAAVTAHLAALDEVAAATTACLYLPMPHELDITGLLALHPDVTWVVTRTPEVGDLTLHAVDAPRERHAYGFEQPVATAPAVAAATVDVFCVPGLAFDAAGNRLGHGAGYYDRLLAEARDDATLVGITLQRRLVTAVPHEPHDVRMDVVVTQRRVLRTPAGS